MQVSIPAITEQVRFARVRMGTYELIDFVVLLIGCTLSGEATGDRHFTNSLLPSPSRSWPSDAAQPVAPSLIPLSVSCCP